METKNNSKENAGDELGKRFANLDKYRREADLFLNMFSPNHGDSSKQIYLDHLYDVVIQTYGFHIKEGGLRAEEAELIRYMINDKEDTIPKDGFLFMCLYTLPSFLRWIEEGDLEKGTPPPHIASREWFNFFVRSKLTEACEELLNGGKSLTEFVRQERCEYMATVGLPNGDENKIVS